MASAWTTRTVYESRQPVDGVAVSPHDGAEVAFVGSALAGDTWDGTVGVVRLSDTSDTSDAPRAAAALPCGASAVCWLGADVVALACDDGTVAVVRVGRAAGGAWDGGTQSVAEDAVHDDMVLALAAPSAGAPNLVASGSADGTVRVWEAAGDDEGPHLQLRTAFAQTAACHGVAWAADGTTLAAAHSDGTLRVYDVRARACAAATRCGRLALTALAAAPGAEPLVAVGDDAGAVRLLDVRRLSDSSNSNSSSAAVWHGDVHGWACTALAMRRDAADGALVLASGGEDCRVVVHRVCGGDGEVVCRDRTHSDAVTALAWRTDIPGTLLSASRDCTILVHAP